jgi:hypothetical protein
MKDIFEIQEEMAVTIVDHLKLKLLESEKAKILRRHTEDHEAYDCYLRGRPRTRPKHLDLLCDGVLATDNS